MVNLSNLSLQNILRYLYKPYHVICIFNQKNNSKTQQLIVIISDSSCCVIVKGFRPLDTEIVDKKKNSARITDICDHILVFSGSRLE